VARPQRGEGLSARPECACENVVHRCGEITSKAIKFHARCIVSEVESLSGKDELLIDIRLHADALPSIAFSADEPSSRKEMEAALLGGSGSCTTTP
jgi:hypothetical protein